MTLPWQDALMKLHVRGWDTDDIDVAADALQEACNEGDFDATEILEMSPKDVARVLASRLAADEVAALLVIADLRAQRSPDSEDLQRALYDLDAFAFSYTGDD